MVKPVYVPLLRAKSGEFTALEKLSGSVKRNILPLFDIPRNGSKAKVRKSDDIHLSEVAASIAAIWRDGTILLDAFSWPADALTSEGEHVLNFVTRKLEVAGLNVIPVIGYDRWDDLSYQEAIRGMRYEENRNFCLRLDTEAIDDSIDDEYFLERISGMVSEVDTDVVDCLALLDLGDISKKSVADFIDRVSGVISVLLRMGFRRIIVGGSSVPPTINVAVERTESEGYLARKEMMLWQSLCQTFPGIVFADYGVRSPNANEEIIAPDTNGKIRYTIERNFFIARGYSLRTREKGAQHHELAAKIIQSTHYLGPEFSWGDAEIERCANGEFRGNSTTWIGIDTNHHVETVVVEVAEFERKYVSKDIQEKWYVDDLEV